MASSRQLAEADSPSRSVLGKCVEERLNVAKFQLEIASLPMPLSDNLQVWSHLNLVYIFDDAMLRARKELQRQQMVAGLHFENDDNKTEATLTTRKSGRSSPTAQKRSKRRCAWASK